jgi:hypothetical protein
MPYILVKLRGVKVRLASFGCSMHLILMTDHERQGDRVTVTLSPGQKTQLEAIADLNATTVAFLVRHAVARFLASGETAQLKLRFPEEG